LKKKCTVFVRRGKVNDKERLLFEKKRGNRWGKGDDEGKFQRGGQKAATISTRNVVSYVHLGKGK